MVKTRGRAKLPILLLSIVIILYASGCAEKANHSPSPDKITTEASSSESKPDLAKSVGIQYLSKSVWKNVSVLTLEFAHKVPLAISEDGMLVWVEWTEEDEKKEKENDTLVMYDIKTGAEETIASVNYPGQITFAQINENWIVWLQSLYGDDSDESCAIYSYNRNTKEMNLCFNADSKDEADTASSKMTPNPSLKGNKLLLDVLSEVNVSGQASYICYEYDLESGEKQEIAQQIIHPEFEDDFIIGVGQDLSNTDKSYSILYRIKNDVLTPLMDEGMYIYDFATDGHGSALYVAQTFETTNIAEEKQNRDIYLMENGKSALLDAQTSEENAGCSWPSISKRVAMWRVDNCPYAYDRLLKKVIRLSDDEQRTSSFLTNDSYMIWTYRSKKNIEENVQTTDLLNIISIIDLPTS